jgi:tRNA 2-thiouridine synthesizing protein A
MADHTLDVRDLKCPLPVLRAKKKLDTLPGGSLLSVVANDPGTLRDFESLCRQIDATLLSSREENGEFHFEIRKV